MARRQPARAAPATLTVDVIVDTAAELAERDGVGRLTMRGIADVLGVSAMALYRHVRTKEELLARIADRHLAEVVYPDDPRMPWQERVAEVFRAVHRVFSEHPELAQILAAQPIDAAAAYRGAEVVLEALEDAGMHGEDAVAAFDTLRSFTTGFSQRENARRNPEATPPLARLHEIQALPPEGFERVRALAGPLIVNDPEERFERGLALLIDGVERQIERSARGD